MNFVENIANSMGNFSFAEPDKAEQNVKKEEEKVQEPPKNKGPAGNLRSRIKELKNRKMSQQQKKQQVGVVYDEEMLLHRNHREEHPERPERVQAIYLNLLKKNLWSSLKRIDCYPAEDEDLLLAHPESHVQKVKDTIYSDKTKKGKNVLLEKFQNSHRFAKDTYENKFTA